MKGKILFAVVLALILIVYSSEINFMPNYSQKTDLWHLFYWILFFAIALITISIANSIRMFIAKKINAKILVILFLSCSFFTLLNNSNHYFKTISFVGIALLLIYILIFKTLKKQS